MVKVKNINTRIQLKNDTETNWNKAKAEEGKDGFIPLLGEAIVYMGENGHGPRIKIGDGETNVVDLPFLEDNDTIYSIIPDGGLTLNNNNAFGIEQNGVTNSMLEGNISSDKLAGNISNNQLENSKIIINAHEINLGDSKNLNELGIASSQDISDVNDAINNKISHSEGTNQGDILYFNSTDNKFKRLELGAGKFLTQSSSNLVWGSISEEDIPSLSPDKIKTNVGTFNASLIPNIFLNGNNKKITGVLPISNGGTGLEIDQNTSLGVLEFSSSNSTSLNIRSITDIANETFEQYLNRKDSQDNLTPPDENVLVTLKLLKKAIPPMNLSNPIEGDSNNPSYYAPVTKGQINSVLISQGILNNNNEGTTPIWLNPYPLSGNIDENLNTTDNTGSGGALFYGRDNSSESSPKPFKTQWGTLPVEQGGTGTTTFIADYVLIGSGENAIRTIAKTYSSTPNTIVERNNNGDFATRAITLSKGLLCNNINNNFLDNLIIDIDDSTKIATFYGNINANNLKAVIGELNMSKTNSETLDQPSIKWYKGSSTKSESAIISQTSTLIGELYWDNNKANRGMLRNYYSSTNGEIHFDSYYLPAVNTSSANNSEFTFLTTADSISGMFPTNSILYSNGNVNKITYKNSANGALYSTSANGSLEWGTLPVAQGGTGLTTSGTVNAVIIGSSIETEKTQKFQTIQSNNGAFYADGMNKKPQFGILPVAQGGTGVTSIENIRAGKDGDGNTISSTYLKLSGGTLTGDLGILFGSTDKFLNFWNNTNKTAGASWRLGVLGSGFYDTNYFVIQSGTSYVNETTWNNAIRIGQNTYDLAVGGNLYPLTDNSKTLGTSSYKWSNVYATTFTGDLTGNATTSTKATQDADGNTISSTYLKLSGGTMTGKLIFNKVQNAIAYTGTKASYDMIKFLDNTDNENGNGISIGGGGATIIGGGESTDVVAEQVSSGWEILYLCNDSDVNVFTNIQNGWDSRKTFTFGSNGTLTASTFSGSLNGNATTATNADKVDDYHASDLWRKDGGTWNGGANISCTPTAANQEYSFDLGNAYTGTYWHVWSGKNQASILQCYNDDRRVVAPARFDTAWLRVVNNSSNNSDDAMVYLENKSNDYWALKINCEGYNYGINIITADNAGSALQTQGKILAKELWGNRGSNGERKVGVDSTTTGNLYLYANTNEKGIYSSSGYMTGQVIQITSSSRTFYGDCTGSAGSVAWGNITGKPELFTQKSLNDTNIDSTSGNWTTSVSDFSSAQGTFPYQSSTWMQIIQFDAVHFKVQLGITVSNTSDGSRELWFRSTWGDNSWSKWHIVSSNNSGIDFGF